MDAVGEWSHSSDMDCEKDKQRIRRYPFVTPNRTVIGSGSKMGAPTLDLASL